MQRLMNAPSTRGFNEAAGIPRGRQMLRTLVYDLTLLQ